MAISISSPTVVPSNTLTITNLDSHHFTNDAFLTKLRAQAESFGKVCFFSPIKSFHRIFVVYHSVFDAQLAKSKLHNTPFEDVNPLRVYFGQHTKLSDDPEKHYLHLPDQLASSASTTATTTTQSETSGAALISPPGSPPVGHVDDQDMEAIDDDFTLDSVSSQDSSNATTPDSTITSTINTPLLSLAPALSDPSETKARLRKLRINTLRTSSASSLSPRSPITPTLLAFSPALDSKGEQPFITIQDWGVETTPCF
ncbi:hypothetical protein BGZ46_007374 [Entomortierella lignicola]|nr:hypothetical protein BGZ46_007374 [Entomortierella lignicola]